MNKVVDLVKKVVDLVDNTKIYSILKATDLSYASQLSNITKNNIYFKREDQIPMHSFKLRGAHQKISRLSKEQIAKGIIASSAGNHAQGVAFSAKKLGINATIVMPFSAAQIKVKSVKSLGANVILHGSSFAEALEHAKKIEKERDLVFVHAFDDIEVVSGQATIGKELIEQLPEVDKIFIPVGGGGLISGIASYVKYHKPKVKIIGVEPEDCSTLYTSLEKKKRLALKEIGSFADGVAVSQIGEDAYEIAKELVEEVILVNNDEICAAVKYIYEDIRSISEPSGALSTAGMRKYINQHNIKNENLVSIISGSNVNFDLLRYISERANVGEQKEAMMAVTIDENAGSLLKFCKILNNNSITEFNYRFGSKDKARILVGISLSKGLEEKKILFDRINKHFDVLDMTDNAIAKNHIRHMVGGRCDVKNEVLYRFEFPEKPGALLNFLNKIGDKYNISLFHYRNQGGDFGRVLIGLQVDNIKKLEEKLDEIGYFYQNETDNKAYHYFL